MSVSLFYRAVGTMRSVANWIVIAVAERHRVYHYHNHAQNRLIQTFESNTSKQTKWSIHLFIIRFASHSNRFTFGCVCSIHNKESCTKYRAFHFPSKCDTFCVARSSSAWKLSFDRGKSNNISYRVRLCMPLCMCAFECRFRLIILKVRTN